MQSYNSDGTVKVQTIGALLRRAITMFIKIGPYSSDKEIVMGKYADYLPTLTPAEAHVFKQMQEPVLQLMGGSSLLMVDGALYRITVEPVEIVPAVRD